MNATGNAVAERDNTPTAMVAQYAGDFGMVLPTHMKAETYVRLAQGVLRRDRNLARIAAQNPGSLMAALLDCARLGHEPGTEQYYLVPFGNEIQGIEGYRGVVERIYRAGAVSSVKAEVVCKNDHFHYEPSMAQPDHKPDWFGDRGEIIGAYAYVIMRDGATSRVVVINKDYLDKVRRQSKGSDKPSSPWVQWYEQMVLKTALRRLEAFVPTSAEYRREQLRAAAEVHAMRGPGAAIPLPLDDAPANVDTETGEIHDAELVDDAGDAA
jgi:recombination protein RecT